MHHWSFPLDILKLYYTTFCILCAHRWICFSSGGTSFRLDIIIVKELSKHTPSTYFLWMKKKTLNMHIYTLFFLTFCNLFSKICDHYQWSLSNTPFFSNFGHFCTLKWCMCVHCLVLKNNANFVNFSYEDDIQLQIQVPPPTEFWRYRFDWYHLKGCQGELNTTHHIDW